jgi:hypothetical protein
MSMKRSEVVRMETTTHPHGRVWLPRIHFYEINDQAWYASTPPFNVSNVPLCAFFPLAKLRHGSSTLLLQQSASPR